MTQSLATSVVAFPEQEISLVDAFIRGLPSEATRDAYRRSIRQFDKFLGDRALLSVNRRDVEAYRSYMDDLGRAPATIGKVMSALTGYYQFALDEGAIDRNPAASARRPKVPQESPRQGLSPSEVRALVRATADDRIIDLRDRALVLLLCVQALRVSEALGLRVEDLSEEARHKVATVTGKGFKIARIPLAAQVHQAIVDWISAAGIETGPIFVAVRKDGVVVPDKAVTAQSAWKRFKGLGVKAGLSRPVHPHLARHGACTAALDAGVALRSVQDLLRHSDPRTTRRYDSHRLSLANPAPHVLASVFVVPDEP